VKAVKNKDEYFFTEIPLALMADFGSAFYNPGGAARL
jgi:hypothetical protein